MNNTNALNIINPTGNSMEHLKHARNKLVMAFHPDRIGDAGLEITQMINDAFSQLSKYVGKWDFNNVDDANFPPELFKELYAVIQTMNKIRDTFGSEELEIHEAKGVNFDKIV